jgi:hypothetical protein
MLQVTCVRTGLEQSTPVQIPTAAHQFKHVEAPITQIFRRISLKPPFVEKQLHITA